MTPTPWHEITTMMACRRARERRVLRDRRRPWIGQTVAVEVGQICKWRQLIRDFRYAHSAGHWRDLITSIRDAVATTSRRVHVMARECELINHADVRDEQ